MMEMHRFASLLMVLIMLLALAPLGLMAEAPVQNHFPRAITYRTGDWIVVGPESNSSEAIMLTGNLIIQSGGSLSLDNVTLMMNSSFDGQFRIEVWSGGSLYLNDTDGNISTVADQSRITNGMSGSRGYGFNVSSGSTFEARNSALENCGLIAGTVGASNSGLTISSSGSILDGMSISGCANGLVIDSCDALVANCTITSNLFNGVYLVGNADPSHRFNATIADSIISDNLRSGIQAEADYVGLNIIGNTISNNMGHGTMLIGNTFANATISGNTVSLNKGLAAIGAMGSPGTVLNLDVHDNTVSENTGTALKFGLLAPIGTLLNEVPVRAIWVNASGNKVTHSGDTGNGILFIYASEYIRASITDNDFLATKMTNGVHIGCLSTTFNLGPATKDASVDFHGNNLTSGSAGALRITSNGTLVVNMTHNNIYGTSSYMACGGVSLGWFQDDFLYATARSATMMIANNSITGVSAGGGLWIDAAQNLSVNVENNTLSSVNTDAIHIGGIMSPFAKIDSKICHNTVGSGTLAGIRVIGSNLTRIFANTVSARSGTFYSGYTPIPMGNGILVESSNLQTQVFNNTLTGCGASGVKLLDSTNVRVHNNTINDCLYGLGIDSFSYLNRFEDNIITKPDNKYGYLISTNSLEHSFPASNTVNGVPFSYFRGLIGTPAAMQSVENIDCQYPPLMSNLGQVVIVNSAYLDINNVTAGNGTNGLFLFNVDHSVISGNSAKFNSVYPGYGINIQSSSDENVIKGNLLVENLYGIGIVSGLRNHLWDNEIIKTGTTRGGLYINPSGAFFDNEISTNNTVNSDPVHYIWNDASGRIVSNISVSSPLLTNLGQVVVLNSANITLDNVSASNGVRGIYLYNSNDATLNKCEFTDNTDNILSSGCQNMSVESSNISGGSNGIRMESSTTTVKNSTIENSSLAHLNLSTSSKIEAINLTYDRARAVISTGSELTVCWHLDVMAYSADRPLEGARISMSNATGATVLDEYTDTNGSIPGNVFVEYRQTSSGVMADAPYTIVASKDGYASYTKTISLDENTFVNATLNDISSPVFTTPSTAYIFETTSGNIIWLNTTLDDSATGCSTIVAAEWALQGAASNFTYSATNPMTASDGAFDQCVENVTASVDISSWDAGNYTFGIRGLDSAGNRSPWSLVMLSLSDDQGPEIAHLGAPIPSRLGTSKKIISLNFSVNDTAMGGSAISAAEWYILNHTSASSDTPSQAYTVLDGSMNEPSEDIGVRIVIQNWQEGDYSIYARGIDSAGNNGDWLVYDVEIFDDVPPSVPIGPWVANTTEHGELRLTWVSNPETDLAGYSIYRTTSPGRDYEFVTGVDATADSWIDTGLLNGTVYYYVMTAFDNASIPNESQFSAEAGARTLNSLYTDDDELDEDTDPETENSKTWMLATLVIALVLVSLILIYRFMRKGH